MPSTTLEPLAAAVAALITSLTTATSVKAYAHDPGYAGLDSLPCGVVGLPAITRTGVDESESQLGARDWFCEFPVSLYFDLADPTFTSKQAIETVEAFIKLVDTESLQAADGTVLDAKVTEAVPVEIVDKDRPMVAYECKLEIFKLV